MCAVRSPGSALVDRTVGNHLRPASGGCDRTSRLRDHDQQNVVVVDASSAGDADVGEQGAYLIIERLREVFRAKGEHGKALLAGLISWCRCCSIPEFTALARTLTRFRELLWNTLGPGGVSNGRAEGINTQLAALTSRARGFHSVGAFIAMAELTCGGLCPGLPGR